VNAKRTLGNNPIDNTLLVTNMFMDTDAIEGWVGSRVKLDGTLEMNCANPLCNALYGEAKYVGIYVSFMY
jgi:hypothetical protein